MNDTSRHTEQQTPPPQEPDLYAWRPFERPTAKYLGLSLLSARFLAAVALALACSLWAAWQLCEDMAQSRTTQMLARERLAAERSAEVAQAIMDQSLSHIRNIPLIIAQGHTAAALLSRFGPDVAPSPLPYAQRNALWLADPECNAFSRLVTGIIRIPGSGINACWLMNAAGDTVAAGISGGDVNFTGANYADRVYFKDAAKGLTGHQFAVGRLTGTPGLFFAAPVIRQGTFLGAVGVRTNTDDLMALLEPNVFVADDLDVIVLSPNPDLHLRALPNAKVEKLSPAEREMRYKRSVFEPIPLNVRPEPGQQDPIYWQGRAYPSVFVTRPSLGGFLTVYAYRFLDETEEIQHDKTLTFALLSLIATLLAASATGVAAFVVNNREHNRALQAINQELTRHATTDPLTGCANRRRFLQAINAELMRHKRHGHPFSVLSIDLDHFKLVNDQHGHLGGDQTLCRFVAVVQATLRPTDLLGRMGGEEFCVLMPDTGVEQASAAAKRIRQAAENAPAMLGATPIHYTVSVGVTQWRAEADTTADDILGRADALLYAAKMAGRNTVVSA